MDLFIGNAAEVVCISRTRARSKTRSSLAEPEVIQNAGIGIDDGRIAWVGPMAEAGDHSRDATVIDATGMTVIPGLVDSHTHLVFAGSRETEFEARLQGKTYQQISAAGGGIQSTVKSVRQADPGELQEQARRRLRELLSYGATTVEVKSGYGLSLEDELKCLRVIAELNREGPWELVSTFLGAHAVPAEYASNRVGYVQQLTSEMLPEVARLGLAEYCDVFCETGVFSLEESELILTKARELGMGLRVHADELSPLGGAELAARLGAASADHLLQITRQGIEALAEAGTVATLLPGTAFFLGEAYAPARRLIEQGAIVALASDCNPGTCPTENLLILGTMACTQMKMLPAEVLAAFTLNAARSLGREDRIGSIEAGKQADLVICDVPSYRHLFYHFGVNHVWRVIKRGRLVHAA
jgi:imidazolonepropionase